MIQSYDQLKKQANRIQELVEENIFVQKIYSSSYYVCVTLRFPGKTRFLYIGRGGGHEGVWISETRVESFLRKRDKFLEYLRKHLSSTSFLGVVCDEKDRIFCVEYQKWGRRNRLYFFYHARNLYFANHYFDADAGHFKLFKSWDQKNRRCDEMDFDLFDEVGRADLERKEDKAEVIDIEKLLKQEKQSAMKLTSGNKSMKFLKRKKGKIEKDLENVKQKDELQQMAHSEESFDKYPMKNKFGGVKLNFKTKDHFKRRNEVFEKVKKLQKAESILKLRLRDTVENINDYDGQSVENKLKTIAPVWKNTKNIEKTPEKTENQYKLIHFENYSVGVGTTAIGNDQLRKLWGNKEDWWFHLEGDKSPHVVVKLKNSTLDENIFKMVGSVLIDFSEFEYQEVNVIYTQVKNLKGVKGATGKVIYKKEKYIKVFIDQHWSSFT